MAQDQAGVPGPVPGALEADDTLLVKALRCREEAAFVALVRRYHSLMLRVAYAQLNDAAAAEEVVQETWLAVIRGIDSFADRTPRKTGAARGRGEKTATARRSVPTPRRRQTRAPRTGSAGRPAQAVPTLGW